MNPHTQHVTGHKSRFSTHDSWPLVQQKQSEFAHWWSNRSNNSIRKRMKLAALADCENRVICLLAASVLTLHSDTHWTQSEPVSPTTNSPEANPDRQTETGRMNCHHVNRGITTFGRLHASSSFCSTPSTKRVASYEFLRSVQIVRWFLGRLVSRILEEFAQSRPKTSNALRLHLQSRFIRSLGDLASMSTKVYFV